MGICIVAEVSVETNVEDGNTCEKDQQGYRSALPVNEWILSLIVVKEPEVVRKDVEQPVESH